MTKKFSMADLEPLIREVLSNGSTFTMMPRGTSMLPLIREGLDSVILSPLPDEISPGDIILYKRDNGQFVLHRVMNEKNGICTMCGDNQVVFEKGILRHHMIAVVNSIIRDGEEIVFSENRDYQAYTLKTLADKKRKNRSYLIKHYVKTVLKKLHIIR